MLPNNGQAPTAVFPHGRSHQPQAFRPEAVTGNSIPSRASRKLLDERDMKDYPFPRALQI